MSYEIFWSSKALKALRKLPRDIAKRVVDKINVAKENPKHFLERLKNEPGYKIRIGDYRALVDIIEEKNVIAIRIVGHRKDIYERYL